MVRYAPVPTHDSHAPDAELNHAFELSDDEDDGVRPPSHNTPLLRRHQAVDEDAPPRTARTPRVPGQYDFELDHFDFQPPPGEPPDPRFARPNSFGNTNGFVPSEPVAQPSSSGGWFRRTFRSILPTHRQQIQLMGAGQDAVFSMMQVKPTTRRPNITRSTAVEHVHEMPEQTQSEAPPSYAAAQADPLPPYWETTVVTQNPNALMLDNYPAGTIFTFLWTFALSAALQWVGFLIAYMLQTSHAGIYGSRAGLGVTFMQLGFYFRIRADITRRNTPAAPLPWPMDKNHPNGIEEYITPGRLMNISSIDAGYDSMTIKSQSYAGEVATMQEFLGYMMMAVGWFLFVISVFGFWRIKRFERAIAAAATPAPAAAPNSEEDVPMLAAEELEGAEEQEQEHEHPNSAFDWTPVTALTHPETPMSAQERQARIMEARLRADLERAGLV